MDSRTLHRERPSVGTDDLRSSPSPARSLTSGFCQTERTILDASSPGRLFAPIFLAFIINRHHLKGLADAIVKCLGILQVYRGADTIGASPDRPHTSDNPLRDICSGPSDPLHGIHDDEKYTQNAFNFILLFPSSTQDFLFLANSNWLEEYILRRDCGMLAGLCTFTILQWQAKHMDPLVRSSKRPNHRHWEYQSFTKVHFEPDTQHLAPVQFFPPHWPHFAAHCTSS